MSRSLHLALATAIGLAFAAPAFAQTRPEERVVTYGDLNLNSAAGADALINRIDTAAEQVCGARTGPNTLSQSRDSRACETETTDNAVYDTNHPVVIARYEGSGYAIIEEGDAAYYDPRLDPTSPQYDARLDPASPYYIPPK